MPTKYRDSYRTPLIMKQKILIATLLSLGAMTSSASDLIDTEPADKLFNIGVRIGVNSSNRTFPGEKFSAWNVNSWGTGFDAGVVVNLNMRQFFTLQPGIFFQSRSGHYSFSEAYVNSKNEDDYLTQLGRIRTYNLMVPIMASFRINVADNLKWMFEAGPYVQFKLHASDSNKIQVIDQPTSSSSLTWEYAKSNFTDWGFKLGSGLLVNDHYSFSIHYLAGMGNVWKSPVEGGKNKAWTFTLGYDF